MLLLIKLNEIELKDKEIKRLKDEIEQYKRNEEKLKIKKRALKQKVEEEQKQRLEEMKARDEWERRERMEDREERKGMQEIVRTMQRERTIERERTVEREKEIEMERRERKENRKLELEIIKRWQNRDREIYKNERKKVKRQVKKNKALKRVHQKLIEKLVNAKEHWTYKSNTNYNNRIWKKAIANKNKNAKNIKSSKYLRKLLDTYGWPEEIKKNSESENYFKTKNRSNSCSRRLNRDKFDGSIPKSISNIYSKSGYISSYTPSNQRRASSKMNLSRNSIRDNFATSPYMQ